MFNVKFQGKKFNLHGLYDQMFRKIDFRSKPFDDSFMSYLEEQGRKLIEKYPSKEGKMSISKIIEEANALARDFVYTGLEANMKLDKKYVEEAGELCMQQLAKSGHRLKRLMVEIYDNYRKKSLAKVESN